MGNWKKGWGLLLLLIPTIGGTGCALLAIGAIGAGVAVGVGAAEYVGGELRQAYAASMEQTWNASLAAAGALKLKATEKSIDNLDKNREIKGKTQDGKDFQISLEAMAKDVTMVKVRIGVFGDEKYSRTIQEEIAKNLNLKK